MATVLRFLGALAIVALMAGSALLMFAPIELAGSALRERLGGYEYVGWPGFGLRVLYTLVGSAALLGGLFAAGRVLARVPVPRALRGLTTPLWAVTMYVVLITPVFAYSGVGVLNAWWDRSPPRAETYVYVRTGRAAKGPSPKLFTAPDGSELALYAIGPPPGAEPGARVTLHRRAGALGMPYLAMKP